MSSPHKTRLHFAFLVSVCGCFLQVRNSYDCKIIDLTRSPRGRGSGRLNIPLFSNRKLVNVKASRRQSLSPGKNRKGKSLKCRNQLRQRKTQ